MSNNMSASLKKLYRSFSEGIGRFMIPKEVQLKIGSELDDIGNANDIVNHVEVEGIDLNRPEIRELYNNTCSRLLFQEMKKQRNIQEIVEKTEVLLENEENPSEEPVNQDWLTRFFNSVEDVSEEKMQEIWSRILAQEVTNPNSFSLRTLDTVSKISKNEALLFEEICKYIINLRGTYAVPNDDNICNKYNISYKKILLLDECGLIDASGTMRVTLTVNKENPFQLIYGNKIVFGHAKTDKKVTIGIYKLTSIGIQMYKIILKQYNDDYLKSIEQFFVDNNNDMTFLEHMIVNELDNGQVMYNNVGKPLNEK